MEDGADDEITLETLVNYTLYENLRFHVAAAWTNLNEINYFVLGDGQITYMDQGRIAYVNKPIDQEKTYRIGLAAISDFNGVCSN